MKKTNLWLLALVIIVFTACSSSVTETTFTATLAGSNEVPAVTTTATGSATLTLDGNTATVTGTYAGLSGAPRAAHVHGPAAAGSNAGVIFALTATDGTTVGTGTLSGTADLTDAQITELKDGLYYVNVHTEANTPGEIRGQLE